VFKAGSTIPVKFQLLSPSTGQPVPATLAASVATGCGATLSISLGTASGAAVDGTTNTSTANTGICFRYDSTANQFIYNLGTKDWNMSAGNNYAITVNVVVSGVPAATGTVVLALK
jgi:hypothetical protein